MPALQIRHVPDDVHQILKARAAQRGQSLAEYAMEVLLRSAQQPTFEELAARIDARGQAGTAEVDDVVQLVRADRDAR
jgi:antitoxin FitA